MRTKHLRRTILELLANEELHGYAVHRKLASSNRHVQLNHLYKILHELRKEGLLEDHWERSRSGPTKRVYKLTRLGRENLNTEERE